MAMSISKINDLVGRKFDYMAKQITITGWTVTDGVYIFATDSDPVSVEESNIELFMSGLIEINNAVQVSQHQLVAVNLQSVPRDIAAKMVERMSSLVDEIANAKTPEQINLVTKKAKSMSNAANTITNLGRLELEAMKLQRQTKN